MKEFIIKNDTKNYAYAIKIKGFLASRSFPHIAGWPEGNLN